MKKLDRKKIVKKLDEIFSQYIRLRDSDSKGIVTCPLCGKKLFRKYSQNMHFVKRGFYRYRFSEKNCHAGCYGCNCAKDGNYTEYTFYMEDKYGVEYTRFIRHDRRPYKISTAELIEKIGEYEVKRNFLLKQKNLEL